MSRKEVAVAGAGSRSRTRWFCVPGGKAVKRVTFWADRRRRLSLWFWLCELRSFHKGLLLCSDSRGKTQTWEETFNIFYSLPFTFFYFSLPKIFFF